MGRTYHLNELKRAWRKWWRRRLQRTLAGEEMAPAEIDASQVHRAVIVLPNWRMGNLLLLTPMAQWLREGLIAQGAEDPRVDICSGGHFGEILAHNPHVERHVSIPRLPWHRRHLFEAIGEQGYDLAILANYAGDPLGLRVAFATGARWRVGAGNANRGPLNIVVDRPARDNPMTDQHRDVLEQLGFACDSAVDLTMVSTPEELSQAREIIASWNLGAGRRPLGVFVCGHRIKQMSFPRWARIISRLRRDFPQLEPIVFQGPGEARKIAKLQRALGEHPVRVVAAPLRQFCALVECMEAFVTCDTGPMHLARAKRVPMVSLFTKANYQKFAPMGPRRVCICDTPRGPGPGTVSRALARVLEGAERPGESAVITPQKRRG